MKLLVAHHSALNRNMDGGCLFSIFIIHYFGLISSSQPLAITNSCCFIVALNFLWQQARDPATTAVDDGVVRYTVQ